MDELIEAAGGDSVFPELRGAKLGRDRIVSAEDVIARRPDDMIVNVVREKEKTNIRTHSHDEGVKLAAPRIHTLESAIEFIAADELVEVTPGAIRVRKRILAAEDRKRAARRG